MKLDHGETLGKQEEGPSHDHGDLSRTTELPLSVAHEVHESTETGRRVGSL
jgi:hypothetical protein